MIAITISGKAYAAIAPTLPPGSVPRDGNSADGEFHVFGFLRRWSPGCALCARMAKPSAMSLCG
jgi:hypothetical protein